MQRSWSTCCDILRPLSAMLLVHRTPQAPWLWQQDLLWVLWMTAALVSGLLRERSILVRRTADQRPRHRPQRLDIERLADRHRLVSGRLHARLPPTPAN